MVEDAAKSVTLAEVLNSGLNTISSEFEVDIALASNKLVQDKEKRARNIMIYDLKCDNDWQRDDQVNDLAGFLNVNQVSQELELESDTASIGPFRICQYQQDCT